MSDDTPSPKDPPPLLERPLTIATGLLTLIGMTVGGGFWAGLHYSESKALADKSELVAQHAQAVADLKICGTHLDTEKSNVAEIQSTCTNTQSTLAEKDRQILELTSAMERQSNCTFIHQQIVATQSEIARPSFQSVMVGGSMYEKEDIERKAMLQERLAQYQQQLGTCNR